METLLIQQITIFAILSLLISLIPAIYYFYLLWRVKSKSKNTKGYVLQVIPPKYNLPQENNKQGVRFSLQRFMDNLTTAAKDSRLSFEIYADSDGIKFLIWTETKEAHDLIKVNLYATYKERIQVKSLDYDPAGDFDASSKVEEYKTLKHYIYSLMDVKDFEGVDPVQNILSALSGMNEGEKALIQIVARPTKIDKSAIRMAREHFRLQKGEITWLGVFASKPENYLFYFLPLLPVLLFKLLGGVSEIFSNNQNNSDPMAILPDSDPRKILVEKVDFQEFNNSIAEKYKTAFACYIRVVASGRQRGSRLISIEQALETMKSENQNRLVKIAGKEISQVRSRFLYPEFKIFPFYNQLFTSQNTLSSREISMLFHLPLQINDPMIESFPVPHIPAKKKYRNKENTSDLLLGKNYVRDKVSSAYLAVENRKRHMVVTGQTGTGKSTILKRMMLQDIDSRLLHGEKRGLMLLDPHEDFFRDILRRLPSQGLDASSLKLWDTADPNYSVGFNPLYAVGMSEREIDLVVDSNFKLIEKLILRANPDAGIGTTGKPMLINAMKTLMIFQSEWLSKNSGYDEIIQQFAPTLIEIRQLFADEIFREQVLSHIDIEKYEGLNSFWEQTLPTYMASKNWPEIRQGFDNKISQITTGSLFNTFAQSKSSFDIANIIRNSEILLVNLSSKHIGEEGMNLLGSLLMAKAWFEAKRIPEPERNPFVVYADEFQNFATPDFATALSEARKFKLELILAHQFFQQLPKEVFHAVMGNVKSKIYYRAGLQDAEVIADELQGKILQEEAMEIPEYNANVKVGEDVFSIYIPQEREPKFSDHLVDELIEKQNFQYAKTTESVAQEVIMRKRWYRDGCQPNMN